MEANPSNKSLSKKLNAAETRKDPAGRLGWQRTQEEGRTPASRRQNSTKKPTPQEDSKWKIPESQESRRQRQEEESWTTEVGAGSSLLSSQTPILSGGAGIFRLERKRHFRFMPSPFLACSALDTSATFVTFSLPFPGDRCLVVTPDVDYMTQHSSRQVDFRVKSSALAISPWKPSVWSRGGPGYARWLLWGLGLRQGPFCRRQPPRLGGGLAAN
ncbi:uncharacterized protein LOC119872821 [Canis lupus familiaris]|uniref:uncharacterized protein LOC119872821 n=1 Tax=Canis lupus familiaris TaxID=9615 RepID=UPI0018F77870|nr:uncharacterized protein LOC119872821 [Canis lupus familiaris]XP_038453936.1 uncharacterized protein LOC119872821 [Canis lupus familiaris]